MAPLKLMNKILGHKMDRNLSCINGILQILKSIPEIDNLFQTKSYQTGCEDDMSICDEISRLFRTEKKQETSAADLRMLINIFAQEIFNCFGVEQDIEIFFRVLHKLVEKELSFSNKQSKDLWQKFNRKQNTKLSCSNHEENKNEFLDLTVPLLDSTNMTVSSLIKKIDENLNKDCRFHKSGSEQSSLGQLPDFLVVKLSKTKSTQDSIVFPESKLRLLNGDTYRLSCIVDHDSQTERYVASVVDDNTWVRCDSAQHTLTSKEDVKARQNLIYLYVKKRTFVGAHPFDKYKCEVGGCPLDEHLESREALKRHTEREHPACVHCKETFLIHCLYKEHMQGNQECKLRRSTDRKKVKHNFLKREKEDEMYTDSGLDSMSDSTAEKAFKVTVKRNYLGN